MTSISMPWMRRCAALLLAGLLAPLAQAQTVARLEQNPVSLGDSVNLTVETDASTRGPDLSPLMQDFDLDGQSSQRSVEWVNGQMNVRTAFLITLTPKRAGTLPIPALKVGNQFSPPLSLTVLPAAASTRQAPASAQRGDRIFLETEIEDATPYVQQSVGVTVRLFYAVPLVSGQLDLDTPDGALLQKVGDDVQSSREVGGRRYNVVERHYLLVPERSGELVLPGPRFSGRGAGGWMDDLLGGNSRQLAERGASRSVQVRPQPAGAPQPWLPLHDLRLRYVAAPQSLRAGEAATLSIEVVADGATRAQMPELPAPTLAGAQVFAEPAQYDESFANGIPRLKMTRRYSLVPAQAGKVTLDGLRLGWWDVDTGKAEQASLPDLQLDVAPGSGGFATPSPTAVPAVAGTQPADPRLQLGRTVVAGRPIWPWLAVAFAVAWLLTLLWAVSLRHRLHELAARSPVPGVPPATPVRSSGKALRQALDTGTLDDVAEALRGMAVPAAPDMDALTQRLAEPAQREAVAALVRARWADGDGVQARQQLREAFQHGPRWQATPIAEASPLEPLYPPRP